MDLIYIGFAAAFIGVIAHVRGRNGIGWAIATPVLAFGFAVLVVKYLTIFEGVSVMAAEVISIPFLYGSPLATFLLLLALGRPATVERAASKADPLAAMTRTTPAAVLPQDEIAYGHELNAPEKPRNGGRAAGGLAIVALLVGGIAYNSWPAKQEVVWQAPVAPAPLARELVIVPEPDPAAQGILLDRTARADAPLTPLVP